MNAAKKPENQNVGKPIYAIGRKRSDKLTRSCRECGCTQEDCSQCIEKTGAPCYWVAWDLCSACETKTK